MLLAIFGLQVKKELSHRDAQSIPNTRQRILKLAWRLI